MYKLVDKPLSRYVSEIDQANPLRWTLLLKEGDTFTTQSCLLKCKDYFNDIVAAYLGNFFTRYGFNNKTYTYYDEGVYVLLSCLNHKESLLTNIGTINKRAAEDGFPPVEVFDIGSSSSFVALLPRAYFKSTYFISLLTYLIRIAHTEKAYDNYEHLVDVNTNSVLDSDHPFSQQKKRCMDGFVIPDERYSNYPWLLYRDETKNLEQHILIHDCGVGMWNNMLEVWAAEAEEA